MSKIQVNEIVNHFDNGAPDCPRGLTIAGVATAATLDVTGNVSVGGTLTYDDVTNIDSVGVITAQNGINVSGGTLVVAGFSTYTGIATFNNNLKVGSKITLNPAAGSATILGSVNGIESSISNGTVSTTIKDGNTQDLYRGIKGSTTVFKVGFDGSIDAVGSIDCSDAVASDRSSSTNNAFVAKLNGSVKTTITNGGSITAAGTLNTGDLSATGGGNRVTADGQIFIRPADSKVATASAIQIYSGGDSGSDATITFKKNGNAEFAGTEVKIGDTSASVGDDKGAVILENGALNVMNTVSNTSQIFGLYGNGTQSFKVTSGGEVTAKENIKIGTFDSSSTSTTGIYGTKDGILYVQRAGASQTVFQVFNGTTSTATIDSSGAASFASGNVIIDLNGAMAIPGPLTCSGSVKIGGTAAANEIDEYEEGTWTPSLKFGGLNAGMTHTMQEGHYTKIGRQVIAQFRLELSAKGGSTGSMTINTPLAVLNTFSSTGIDGNVLVAYSSGMNAAQVGSSPVSGYCDGGTTLSYYTARLSTGDAATMNQTDVDNDFGISGTMFFYAA